MRDREPRVIMSEKTFKELAIKGSSLLSIAALATATGCSVNNVEAHIPTEVPEPTIEPFPTPSPEFVLAIEKTAQETIDTQFEGLGIHDTRLIGDVLSDASGQNRFALFESQLPNRQTNEDMSFLMIAGVGEENKIESVRGLVASEAYPPEGDILAFASVTFDAQTQIFEIQDPYVRTNTQTGEIEIATDGMTWVPLLASPYTYNEVRATLGGGGVLAARALPTPTTEPTPEPTPTPTEIPQYTGPLVDVTQDVFARGARPEFKSSNSYNEHAYYFSSPYHLTLVSISTIPETQITEHVWGFRLKDQDYRFRTRSATCYIISDLPVGVGLDKLQIGLLYRPSFGGFEAPIAGTEYMQILSSEQNSSCKAVRENLRVDPEDKSRLINFFRSGNTDGFSVDESGIVDLTQVISPYNSY